MDIIRDAILNIMVVVAFIVCAVRYLSKKQTDERIEQLLLMIVVLLVKLWSVS